MTIILTSIFTKSNIEMMNAFCKTVSTSYRARHYLFLRHSRLYCIQSIFYFRLNSKIFLSPERGDAFFLASYNTTYDFSFCNIHILRTRHLYFSERMNDSNPLLLKKVLIFL